MPNRLRTPDSYLARGYRRLPAPSFLTTGGTTAARQNLRTGTRFGSAAAQGGGFGVLREPAEGSAATGVAPASTKVAGKGPTYSVFGRYAPEYTITGGYTGGAPMSGLAGKALGSRRLITASQPRVPISLRDIRTRTMATDRITGTTATGGITARGISISQGAESALEDLTRRLQSNVESEVAQARQMLNRAWTTIEQMGIDPEDREALGTAMRALLENPTLSERELQAEIQRGVEQISAETGAQLDILAAEGGAGARQKRWDILEKGTGARIKHERETRLEYAKRLGEERRADYATAAQIGQTLAEADTNKVQAMLSATGAALDIGDYGRQVLGGALEALTTYTASFDPTAAAEAIASGVGAGTPRITYSRMRRG